MKKIYPKIRKISAVEQKGSGPEPEWADIKRLSTQEYLNRTAKALNWYYGHYTKKEGQEWFEAWFNNHAGRHPEELKLIRVVRQDSISNLLCFVYALEQRGWVARLSILRKIHADIQSVLELVRSKQRAEEDEEEDDDGTDAPRQSVAERVREQAGAMSEEIDGLIDQWILNPSTFDPKSVKIISLLRSKHVKGPHARCIKGIFARGKDEATAAVSPDTPEHIKESYKHLSKKDIRKLVELYDGVFAACDLLIEESKVNRKPRAKKAKSNDELVKNVKILARDDSLGLVGAPATSIIGSSAIVVFNVKTRKVGCYVASGSGGLSVKGTTLLNFSDKSAQRSVRKPAEQLKSIKDLTTMRKYDNWFRKELTSMETPLSGRLSEDTLILKVYK